MCMLHFISCVHKSDWTIYLYLFLILIIVVSVHISDCEELVNVNTSLLKDCWLNIMTLSLICSLRDNKLLNSEIEITAVTLIISKG